MPVIELGLKTQIENLPTLADPQLTARFEWRFESRAAIAKITNSTKIAIFGPKNHNIFFVL